MRKIFQFALIFMSLLLIPAAVNFSYASRLPYPLVTRLEGGKTTHQCVMLFPTTFPEQTYQGPPDDLKEMMGIERFPSVGVENYCGSKLVINSLEVTKEVESDGKKIIGEWKLATPLLTKNKYMLLLSTQGIACEIGGPVSFISAIARKFSLKDENDTLENKFKDRLNELGQAPVACSSIVLNDYTGIHLEIPGSHVDGSLFKITGSIGGKPYMAQAKIFEKRTAE